MGSTHIVYHIGQYLSLVKYSTAPFRADPVVTFEQGSRKKNFHGSSHNCPMGFIYSI